MFDLPFEKFISRLKINILRGLPGEEAQRKMSPVERANFSNYEKFRVNSKKSAVTVILYPKNNQVYVVLIKRASYDGVHSDQISFPGGKQDQGDITLLDTAIRETKEEIGIDIQDINLIGKLSDLYIPPSNFWVEAYLCFADKELKFIPNYREVKDILEIPLQEFNMEANIQQMRIKNSEGLTYKYPCYNIRQNIIWGATAMILSEVSELTK